MTTRRCVKTKLSNVCTTAKSSASVGLGWIARILGGRLRFRTNKAVPGRGKDGLYGWTRASFQSRHITHVSRTGGGRLRMSGTCMFATKKVSIFKTRLLTDESSSGGGRHGHGTKKRLSRTRTHSPKPKPSYILYMHNNVRVSCP